MLNHDRAIKAIGRGNWRRLLRSHLFEEMKHSMPPKHVSVSSIYCKKNDVNGKALLKNVARLSRAKHNLRDWLDRRSGQPREDEYPRIVWREALIPKYAVAFISSGIARADYRRWPRFRRGNLPDGLD